MDAATWTSDDWLGQAQTWLDEQLAAAGTPRTGELTQPRVRAWGTVLRADTTAGPVWLKAPGPETVFEVQLYRLLATIVPRFVLDPIAADVERGWVLLPDGGPTLREQLGDHDLSEVMVQVLPQYAQLQLDLMPHAEDLLATGVTDMRPAVMPQRFEEALEATGRYVAAEGDAEARERHTWVAGQRKEFTTRCADLPDRASLDHNDLHTSNILGRPGGPVRFYDWGDSVLAHAFSSMLIPLLALTKLLDVDPDDQLVRRPRDAYLEVFGNPAELLAELELACWIGKVARALVWERSLHGDPGEFADAPLETLLALRMNSWHFPA
ncbi:aminoglycoside phosphotransferase family protein [Streptomyces sp. SID13031]|uniref:aminoglycoside phosphotransferase family protein n=1 Tax=Streptomyces sp. SID13031 TaxID=2706046 RepID=UPI0013CC6B5D|nr:aminoglycoside phosphotransferase family protein [Streptomyces sp. SID13031]NEA32162.1 aminoglycoside phosphotransferase family protein [Streptomyces sp. SID13031]